MLYPVVSVHTYPGLASFIKEEPASGSGARPGISALMGSSKTEPVLNGYPNQFFGRQKSLAYYHSTPLPLLTTQETKDLWSLKIVLMPNP
jgi:hypothetical protein